MKKRGKGTGRHRKVIVIGRQGATSKDLYGRVTQKVSNGVEYSNKRERHHPSKTDRSRNIEGGGQKRTMPLFKGSTKKSRKAPLCDRKLGGGDQKHSRTGGRVLAKCVWRSSPPQPYTATQWDQPIGRHIHMPGVVSKINMGQRGPNR